MYNQFYGNTFNPGFGYVATQPQEPPVFNQLLTADEVAKLQKNPNLFSTKLTEDEYLRAVCTHKDMSNRVVLERLPNGKHRCAVCQAEFYLLDLNTSKEEIERVCNDFYDLFQSIKTFYGNAPAALREFYLITEFIPKVKHLWDVAKQYFEKVTGGYGSLTPNNDQSGFAVLSSIMGNGAIPGMAPTVGPMMYPQPGFPQAGYYGGNPIPQASVLQTPQAVPGQPMAPQQPVAGAGYAMPQPNAQGMYGYNPATMVTPAPSIGMQSPNPIGYVDPNAGAYGMPQTPQAVNQAGQPQSATQPPPMPAAPPANPNIKADVGKTFEG